MQFPVVLQFLEDAIILVERVPVVFEFRFIFLIQYELFLVPRLELTPNEPPPIVSTELVLWLVMQPFTQLVFNDHFQPFSAFEHL